MTNLTGKIKNTIYHNEENCYTVAIFRVKTSDIKHLENTTIQIVGNFYDLKYDVNMNIDGDYVLNDKYKRYQVNVNSYNYIIPSTEDKVIEFLRSKLVVGCGKKTASILVEAYGKDTLEVIKDVNKITVLGISEKVAIKINDSVLNYDKTSNVIIALETLGFSVDESARILAKFKDKTLSMLDNVYLFKEVIDFKKLDNIYVSNNDRVSDERIYHCLLETMKNISFSEGHTYYDSDLIINGLKVYYNITVSKEKFDSIIVLLVNDKEVYIDNSKIYLKEYNEGEVSIASYLKKLSDVKRLDIIDFSEKIKAIENLLNIDYDEIQEKAIKEALCNNVTIISGGPGTGKTTILNGILRMYINENKLSTYEVSEKVALLAPTGRASKRMSEATGFTASTIHRYLKWHKESDSFEFDEFNKTMHHLVIIDEASMIDVKLFSALLKALQYDAKLILVGDSFQLPSVSAGKVLNDLIESDLFNFINLTKIYRQSDNSFIPYLAREIKNGELEEDFLTKKDDYNFINCDSDVLHIFLKKVIISAREKGINDENMQVLVPVYKGENGIDNLNLMIREIYNPHNFNKSELLFGDVTYREADKIIILSNDPDNNVFNGDIGYIKKIDHMGKSKITLSCNGNDVTVDKKYLKNIKHAYAISVHKSQGSEFEHVIMPVCREYYMMMYNKLIYTGVSRAKKSLILLGDPLIFSRGVHNSRADMRNTTLKDRLESIFYNN